MLRLVGQMHIAETREQARANARFGFLKWLHYLNKIIPARYADLAGYDPIDRLVETGRIVCGTPDDAIAQIEKFYEKQGEFGCFLQAAHNWADFEATKKSYELDARYAVRISPGRTSTAPPHSPGHSRPPRISTRGASGRPRRCSPSTLPSTQPRRGVAGDKGTAARLGKSPHGTISRVTA